MITLPIDILKPGMKIAQAIFTQRAKLVNKDVIIDEKLLDHIRQAGIRKVCVYDDDIDPALIPDSPQNLYNDLVDMLNEIRLKVLTEANFNMSRVNRLIDRLASRVVADYRPFTEMIRMRKVVPTFIDHMADVCIYSVAFAKLRGMSILDMRIIGIAGLLHDIGKFFVPENILKQATEGNLSESDQFLVMNHTVLGHDLLAGITGVFSDVLEVVIQHHERLDGSGYPYGLIGERISNFTRMVSVADIYCNLINPQSKGIRIPGYEVAEIVEIQAGTKLDRELVGEFMSGLVTYPLQSAVRLSTGMVGRVVYQNRGFPTRPVVKLGSDKLDLSKITTVFIEDIIELAKNEPDKIIY